MSYEVVIVGAGAAGIAAARWLQTQGIESLIVEARNRVGGRAWTDTRLGVPVDMGCAWLHSAETNPWTDYARRSGFEIVERLPDWQRRIGASETSPEYRHAWHQSFMRNEQLIAGAVRMGRDIPVADIVPDDSYRPMFDAVMGWLMGVNSEHVSSVDYDRYQDSDINWAVPRGLGTLISHAADSLSVQLATPVRTIDHSGPDIKVSTDSGVIAAKAVIVTVPTSVLARDALRFVPHLPLAMREAFDAVPLGVDNKVFFRVAPGAMPFAGTAHFIGTDTTARTGSYATRPTEQEGVLLAFYGGSLALELEQRGELESFARAELSQIFGADFATQLETAVATGWHGDEWSCGSYSAARPGKAHFRERLQEPVGRIFFAGEAASLDSFGTIHGAWFTGVAAARRALETLKTG